MSEPLFDMVFSHYGMTYVLSILLLGANPGKQKYIMDALSINEEKKNMFFSYLRKTIELLNSQEDHTFAMQNTFLYPNNVAFMSAFSQGLARLNVSMKTANKGDKMPLIPNVQHGPLKGYPNSGNEYKPSTPHVSTAIYQALQFELKWTETWDVYKPQTFHGHLLSMDVPLMRLERKLNRKTFVLPPSSGSGPDGRGKMEAVQIPFSNKNFSIFFFLPHEMSINDAVTLASPVDLANEMMDQPTSIETAAVLPIFAQNDFQPLHLTIRFVNTMEVLTEASTLDQIFNEDVTVKLGGIWSSSNVEFNPKNVLSTNTLEASGSNVYPRTLTNCDLKDAPELDMSNDLRNNALIFNRPFIYMIYYNDGHLRIPILSGIVGHPQETPCSW